MARHVMLRPEHRGKRFKLEYRRDERNEVNELFGAHSLDEIRAVLEVIEGAGGIGDAIGRRGA